MSRPGRSAFRGWLEGYRQGESLTRIAAQGMTRYDGSNNKICFEGNDASDGEPHYGSGFWVDATMPADREREAEEAKRREEARRARNGGTLWW